MEGFLANAFHYDQIWGRGGVVISSAHLAYTWQGKTKGLGRDIMGGWRQSQDFGDFVYCVGGKLEYY